MYSAFASFYDEFNSEIDYTAWAKDIDDFAKKHTRVNIELALDLGCGTGSMALELAKLGYDMTCVDISPDMLDIARIRAQEQGIGNMLLLCQDLCNFELYGTVDMAVCCLDTVNHMTDMKKLKKFLSLVHNYLVPGGLFFFDVNTPQKFETVYADNAYVLEGEGVYCGWQNYYDVKSRICDFYLSVFEEQDNGSYLRCDDFHREKCYSMRQIKNALSSCGFEIAAICNSSKFDMPPADNDMRWYFAVYRK
jgi:SAM-dependent methyltransferase